MVLSVTPSSHSFFIQSPVRSVRTPAAARTTPWCGSLTAVRGRASPSGTVAAGATKTASRRSRIVRKSVWQRVDEDELQNHVYLQGTMPRQLPGCFPHGRVSWFKTFWLFLACFCFFTDSTFLLDGLEGLPGYFRFLWDQVLCFFLFSFFGAAGQISLKSTSRHVSLDLIPTANIIFCFVL